MFCSLQEAFPQRISGKGLQYSSCWYAEPKPNADVKPATIDVAIPTVTGAVAQRCVHHPDASSACDAHLHHVLSCDTCQRLLWLHFREKHGDDFIPRRRTRSRGHRGVGASVLDSPVNAFGNKSVTWGTLLVILAVSSILLLMTRLFAK